MTFAASGRGVLWDLFFWTILIILFYLFRCIVLCAVKLEYVIVCLWGRGYEFLFLFGGERRMRRTRTRLSSWLILYHVLVS